MNELGEPYVVLYGAALLLFGAAAVLAALLQIRPQLGWPLTGVLGTLTFLFLGLLGLDVTRLYALDMRPSGIAYRWLSYAAAVVLLATATAVLGVFGDRIAGAHGREYRVAVRVCIAASFLAMAGIVLQPFLAMVR